jgi:hypothetical protein
VRFFFGSTATSPGIGNQVKSPALEKRKKRATQPKMGLVTGRVRRALNEFELSDAAPWPAASALAGEGGCFLEFPFHFMLTKLREFDFWRDSEFPRIPQELFNTLVCRVRRALKDFEMSCAATLWFSNMRVCRPTAPAAFSRVERQQGRALRNRGIPSKQNIRSRLQSAMSN